MCDNDVASIDYFNKHLDLMKQIGEDSEYINIQNISDFFDENN